MGRVLGSTSVGGVKDSSVSDCPIVLHNRDHISKLQLFPRLQILLNTRYRYICISPTLMLDCFLHFGQSEHMCQYKDLLHCLGPYNCSLALMATELHIHHRKTNNPVHPKSILCNDLNFHSNRSQIWSPNICYRRCLESYNESRKSLARIFCQLENWGFQIWEMRYIEDQHQQRLESFLHYNPLCHN